jgi:uroporphyrinogen-III synthase
MKIRSVLISQPKPETEKSPYYDVAKTHKVSLEFKPFIQVVGVTAAELRKQKVDFTEYACVIMTSKSSVDHYFRLAQEMRFVIPEGIKYFCASETIALYMQKYIVYRKRKIFHGTKGVEDLVDYFKKNKNEKFLFPCSDKHSDKITDFLTKSKISFTKASFYKTVATDMLGFSLLDFDMIVFFSPNGIESLTSNYPEFKQGDTHIGTFGEGTALAAESAGLTVQLKAPMPKSPSMAMALDFYLKQVNGKSGK